MADWQKVSGSNEYKALSDEDKDAVRADFFDRAIAPNLNADDVPAIRSDFMDRTKPTFIGKVKDVAENAVNNLKSAFTLNPQDPSAPSVAPKPVAASGVTALAAPASPDVTPYDFGALDGNKPTPAPIATTTQSAIDSVKTPDEKAAEAAAAVPVPTLDAQHGFADRSMELRGAQDSAAAQAYRAQRAAELRKQVPQASDQTINNMVETEIATGNQASPSTVSNSNFDFDTHKQYADAGTIERGVAKGVNSLEQSAAGVHEFLGDVLGADGYRNAMADTSNKLGREASAIGDRPEYLTRNWEGAVSSIISQAPGLAISALSGGSVPLLLMGAQQFGSDYHDGRAAGLDKEDATTRAAVNGVAEIVGEKIGMPSFTKVFKDITHGVPTDQLIKHLAEHIIKEVPGEELTTAIEFANDKFTGYGQNKQASLQDYLKQAADTLVQTVMQAGAMGGTGVAENFIHARREQAATVAADVAKANALAQWQGAFSPAPRPAGTLKRAATVAAQTGMVQQAAADLQPAPSALDATELLDTEGDAHAGGQLSGNGKSVPSGTLIDGVLTNPELGGNLTDSQAGVNQRLEPGNWLTDVKPMELGSHTDSTNANPKPGSDLAGGKTIGDKPLEGGKGIVDVGSQGEPIPIGAGINGASSDAKFFSDLASSKPFVDKGLEGLDRVTLKRVFNGVAAGGHDLKVLDPVIKLIPVDVVNMLRSGELTPDVLLDNPAMFTNASPIRGGDEPVSTTADRSGPAMNSVAGDSTKDVVSGNSRRASGKDGAALGTIEGRHNVTPGNVGLEAGGADTSSASPILASQSAIARVGTTPKSTESVTVRNGVVYLGDYPAQNFETGEDITVTEPTFEAVSKALKDGGALSNKQRIYGGTAAQTEAKGGNPFKRAYETLVAGSMPQGVKDPEQAKAAFDSGKIKNAGDLRRFEENGYPQPKQPKVKMPKAAEPAKTADEFAERARKQFVKTIKDMGGISVTESKDVTGEPAHIANRMAPGLFRTGGNALDLVARRLHEAGYLSDEHYNDVDGGVQATRDLVNRALGKEPVMTAADQERYNELAQQEQRLAEQEHALTEQMPAHNETLAEIIADEADDDIAFGDDVQHSDPAADMRAMGFTEDEINEAIKPKEEGAATSGTATAGRAGEGHQAGQGQAATEGSQGQDAGFALEHQTEAELAANDQAAKQKAEDKAKEDAAAEAKRRADAERGDFQLTGSDRASDANAGQGDIFSQPAAKKPELPASPSTDAMENRAKYEKMASEKGDAYAAGHHANAKGFSMHPPSVYRSQRERNDWERGWLDAKREQEGPSVTPQVPTGDMEKYIKVAADSIQDLRKVDVYRVLVESNRAEFRQAIASYIKDKRPDLAAEVDAVMAEAGQESPAPTKREQEAKPNKLDAAAASIDAELDAALDDLAAALKNQGSQLNSGVDPKILALGVKVGSLYVAKGVVKFAQYSRAVLDALRSRGVDPEHLKPYLKQFYAATKQEVDDATFEKMDDDRTVRGFDLSSLDAAKSSLPDGWDESQPGGMATNSDPVNGGIVDTEIASGKWFAVSNNKEIGTLDGFATRDDALAALASAVKAATIGKTGENNVTDQRSGTRLEPDSQDTATQDGMGEKDVRAGRAADGRTGGQGVQNPEGESGAGSSGLISGYETAPFGERGDLEIYTGGTRVSPSTAGGSVDSRGGEPGVEGPPIEPEATDLFGELAESGLSQVAAKQAQIKADKQEHKPGLANIRETLPVLTEGQQEDVHKTETRFAVPDGYGMLFTNGTGTGKTFTGLGVIKRHVTAGKGNILIVAPNDKIIEDWQKSGELLALKLNRLADTNDAGQGVVITTYANMGQNDALASRDWDLIVHDEAHYLAMDKDGTNTNALKTLRAISLHPDGAYLRAQMQNRTLVDRMKELSDTITSLVKAMNNADLMDQQYLAYKEQAAAAEKEFNEVSAKWDKAREDVKNDVAARQGEARTRALFLSATPFAYEKTVDWANGYLFDYNEGRASEEGNFRGYNQGSNRDQFFMQHFGYRMRTNKLSEPDAKVDRGLMQRQFNGWLKKSGALSGRMLDVKADYDRRFVLVDSAIGTRIDEALQWFDDKRKARAAANNPTGNPQSLASYKSDPKSEAMRALRDIIAEKFDYLSRRYLLEAIKAREVIPHVREHLALGRKVVVFHDYKKGGGFNPFNIVPRSAPDSDVGGERTAALNEVIGEFRREFRDLIESDVWSASSPITAFQREFPNALLFNGDVPSKQRRANVAKFQDDASGPQVMLVQSAAGKEGISLHDTTGKHQRTLFNLGQPTQPTTAIQQEGRIYRTGQVTDAIFRYLNTGTNWEKWAFATTIAHRASTAENLGMGELARALKDAFIAGFEESGDYRAGMEGEGKGGKERDRAANDAITEYDRAKAFYYGTQKKNSKTKAQEGADYFATPEPLGLKMVEWANMRPGEDFLEPSAGHGAIARWAPDDAVKTGIEPSSALRPRLAMVFDGKIVDSTFEDLNIVNKYDAIVMNPPFGSGGRTAIDHVAKAAQHLRDGGRIVALIPTGPAADKKFEKWFYEEEQRAIKPLFEHPTLGPIYKGDTVTTRAGWLPSGVVTRRDTAGNFWFKKDANSETMVSPEAWTSVEKTGPRTGTYRPAANLYLAGEIKLPQVTFERAGTAVATRVVVIEKQTDKDLAARIQQANRDLSGETDINDLFNRLENVSLPDRTKPAEDAPAASVAAPVKTKKEAVDPVAAQAAASDMGLNIIEHTTGKGKVIRGVVRTDLTKDQAKAIDEFTFRKDGGYFIREKHLAKMNGVDANMVGTPAAVYGSEQAGTQDKSIVAEPNDSSYTDPYETGSFETRPDTQPKQTEAGRAALADAERRILGAAGGVRGAGASLLGSRISSEFRANGGASLVGQTVESAADLAFAAQILRDPRFETFRIFYTDAAGKVVGERVHSSRLAGAAYLPSGIHTSIRSDMAENGAAGYWLLHNHPSGSATESKADLALTSNLARMVNGFQGHVVIDHNEYNHISLDGMAAVGNVIKAPQLAAIDLTANPEKAHPLLGEVISAPSVLAGIAKRLQQKDGYVTLIGTDAQLRISMLTEVPTAYLMGARGNKAKQLRAIAAAKRASRETGSTSLFAAVPGNLMDFGALIDSGLFRDVVPMDGSASASSLGIMNSGGLPVTAAEMRGGKSHAKQDDTTYDAGGQQRIPDTTTPQAPQITVQPPLPLQPEAFDVVIDSGNPYANLLRNPKSRNAVSIKALEFIKFFGDLLVSVGVKPSVSEGSGDGLVSNAKSLSDLTQTKAFVEHGYGGLDAPAKLLVLKSVGGALHNLQVLNAVVERIPVDVMDLLVGKELSTKERLHDMAMLADTSSVNTDNPVAAAINMAAGVVSDVAAAKRAKGSPRLGDVGLVAGKGGSANGAGTGNLGHSGSSSWVMPDPTKLDDIIYKLQNSKIDTKRVIEAIQQTGKQLADKWNPYLQEELFHGRASKRTLDFVDRELNPMLKQAQASGLTLAEIDQYLHARHAEEANALIAERDPSMPDGGSGMKDAEARAYLDGLPADKARDMAAVAERVDAMLAKTRQLYADYGLESQDTVDEWGRMFKHYVPLMREDKGGGMGTGQGFSIKGREVKHRTGSTRAVVDILANVAMQREKAIVRGEKNRVAVSLAGLAKLHPNPDFWTFDKVPTERVLNENTGLVETRANPTFKTRPNVIVAKIKGKGGQIEERAIVFNERNERALRMVQALKNLDMTRLDGLMGTLAKVTRYFSAINTQYNPVFGFVNLTRDIQDAAINLSSTPLKNKRAAVVGNTFSALSGIYRDVRAERRGGEASSKWAHLWEEFNLEGGQTGYRDLYATSADRAKAIQNVLEPDAWMKTGWGKVFTAGGVLKVPLSVAQKSVKPLFDWLSDFNETMENAVRLSSYKVGLEQGLSKQRAASLAKNLTVNFNRKGQSSQQAGALYAFFNASMQGTARMGGVLTTMQDGDLKTLRLSGTGMKIIGGGVLLGVMQAALLAAAGFGDDDPPEFVRQNNLIIPLTPVSGKKNYLMIPMPLGYRVFPNIGRILADVAIHGGKDAGKRLFDIMGIVADAFDPLGGSGLSLQTLSPTALDPLVSLATNQDWAGKTIYHEDFNSNDPTPGFTRTKDTASSYAKALAEAINYATGGTEYTPGKFSPTPDQIDYLVSQVTGGVGREFGKAEQTINSISSGEDMPAYKIPLAGRYYGSSEGQASQAGRFYENIKRANEYGNEIIGRRKDGKDVGDYLDANPDAQEMMMMGRQAEARVKALRQRKLKMVRENAPREDVKDIEAQITETMLDFNERSAEIQVGQ